MLPEPSNKKMSDIGGSAGPNAGEHCGEITRDGLQSAARESTRGRPFKTLKMEENG